MQHALNSDGHHQELLQRRRDRRVTIALEGRFMLSDGSEHRCVTRNVSPGGLEISAPVKPRLDEKVITYIEVLGRIEGKAVRLTPSGFALKCAVSHFKRDKLATQLTWLINKDHLELEDQRTTGRVVAGGDTPAIVEADGVQHPAAIIDFSLKGVAFSCGAELKLGDVLQINQKPCIVVRRFEGGYGAAFLESRRTLTG